VILYGRNPVREALRGRRAHQIADVWATAGAARESWLQGVPIVLRSVEEIERRCGTGTHQGICAEAGGYPYVGVEEILSAPAPLIVVLDQIQDPHNLGSICRSAECVGATGVVIPERRSAEVTPTVCKTSAGAVEHLGVARARNVADFLAAARQADCWVYGASIADGAVPYDSPDYSGGVVLVLGSEGSGLRPRVAAACDQLVSLPLRGRVDSLGVSAAAAALLYGILQSRTASLDKAP
jgi:23S rRNA (guanosine2251-2'-O)-methyltransferase